jgi:hypothetical protein
MNEEEIYRKILEEGVDDWVPADRLVGLVLQPQIFVM